jgi:isoquinoline 1-oxidoreductase
MRKDYDCRRFSRACLDSPYAAPNSRVRFLYTDSPRREGSYRGIAATANNFAREAFIDELAVLSAADPLEFRLANLDNPRLKAAFEAAAKKFDWKRGRAYRHLLQPSCGTRAGRVE